MMFIFGIMAALGILVALYITGHLIITEPDPYHRVAIYLTILASSVAAVMFAYILLPPAFESALFTFSFTQFLTWSIMDKHAMVHGTLPEE